MYIKELLMFYNDFFYWLAKVVPPPPKEGILLSYDWLWYLYVAFWIDIPIQLFYVLNWIFEYVTVRGFYSLKEISTKLIIPPYQLRSQGGAERRKG